MNYNPIDNAAPKNIGDHLEKIYQLTKNHAPLKAFLKEEEREVLKNLVSPKIATSLVITDPTEPDDPLPIDPNYLSNLCYPSFADNCVLLPEGEESYAIVWQSANSLFFELPTGGTAKMWGVSDPNRQKTRTYDGETVICRPSNILYFAKKEQCLALAAHLRRAFKPPIKDCRIFRVSCEGDLTLIYPNDGTIPSEVAWERVPMGILPGVAGIVD